MTRPLVSVVIPTYNRAGCIRGVIDSVLRQSYPNIETIVVDDGSIDDTAGVVKAYGDRVIYRRQSNAGPSAARNTGAGLARGELLAFLDSDDSWMPGKIEAQVRALELAGSRYECCVANAAYGMPGTGNGASSFGYAGLPEFRDGRVLANPFEFLTATFLLFNQCVMLRRCAFEEVGGFHPGLRIMEDHHLALRVALRGPWLLLGERLVIKDEGSDGLGAEARGSGMRTLQAALEVSRGVRAAPSGAGARQRFMLGMACLYLSWRRRTVTLEMGESGPARHLGACADAVLKKIWAVWRRLPFGPRARLRPLTVG